MNNPTYREVEFMEWWAMALGAFAALNLRQPRYGEARDAYKIGESPVTFATYAAGIDGWNDQPCGPLVPPALSPRHFGALDQ